MMRKRVLVIAGLALLPAIAAVAAYAMTADEPGEPGAYTDDDDGAAIILGVGDSITIRLAGNPTTRLRVAGGSR